MTSTSTPASTHKRKTSAPDLPPIHKGLVTTIIPVFNRPKMVRQAIESVLAQTYQSLQIIVIDDGSTDETPKVLKRIARKSPTVLVLKQENQGPGAARQLGLEHAEGEYIQFLDSDDLLSPSKFTSQIAALKADAQAVASYGKTELLELKNDVHSLDCWKRTGEKIDTLFPLILNERWWGTSSPLYRHRALRKIGPMLPLVNEEDWEYDCRLAARGGKLAFIDEFVSIQRRHGDNISQDGGVDPAKLIDRCVARKAMYRSARKATKEARELIKEEDFITFSKATFLLARECAAAGLSEQVHDMLKLSIKANKGPTREHQVFVKIGNLLGWKNASLIAKVWQRVKRRG